MNGMNWDWFSLYSVVTRDFPFFQSKIDTLWVDVKKAMSYLGLLQVEAKRKFTDVTYFYDPSVMLMWLYVKTFNGRWQ